MVRFANTCLVRINELTAFLESALGPGTGDLAMRFGIHSGPVTAGVLRGEKSRFQLFGDTMNIASRVEPTGARNKVHLSRETANLLIEAGKSHWVEMREDVITATGKGVLQTYWLKPKAGSGTNRNSVASETSSDLDNSAHLKDLEGEDMDTALYSRTLDTIGESKEFNLELTSQEKKRRRTSRTIEVDTDIHRRLDRLVDWNVEMLLSLLKKMVAQRSDAPKTKPKPKTVPSQRNIAGNPLDEVKEVMQMPSFDIEAAIKMTADSNIELRPEVRSELRAYIKCISGYYEDNPFHNFEHASHVCLSANKLLKRIVMPDDVDYRRDSQQKEIEKVKSIATDLHKHTYGLSSDPVTQFAVVFSALIHDTGHTGVPNFQLAVEEPDVATKYQNKSIAEQRSVDLAWERLMDPCYNNLRECMFPTQVELKHFRQLVVNSVLATDIFDKELSALRKARWQKAFHPDKSSAPDSEKEAFNRKATIVIEHIIQASDVAVSLLKCDATRRNL
jgi:hypothetical protein